MAALTLGDEHPALADAQVLELALRERPAGELSFGVLWSLESRQPVARCGRTTFLEKLEPSVIWVSIEAEVSECGHVVPRCIEIVVQESGEWRTIAAAEPAPDVGARRAPAAISLARNQSSS